jgi:hypothetical protein
MPATQQREIFSTEEAERFAALWAGFDMGNASEAEAMGKGRALRRMLAGKTLDDGRPLRLVDALELPEIRAALDAQMQPLRPQNEEVNKLNVQNAELKEELKKEYVRNAELAETIGDLRRQLAGAASCVFFQAGAIVPVPPCLGGLLAFAGVMGGAALLFKLGAAALQWFGSL